MTFPIGTPGSRTDPVHNLDNPEPQRFEFRVFGSAAIRATERLKAVGTEGGSETRTDHYVIARNRPDLGLKLRDGDQLDLKLLCRETKGLELWMPVDRTSLPLEGAEITARFLDTAELECSLDSTRSYGWETLLQALLPYPNMRDARVTKKRRRYEVGECLAEMTILQMADHVSEVTCAVEGPDPARLKALVEDLGCANCRNLSYPVRLIDVLFTAT